MRRDTLIAFLLVLGIHVGVAMVPKHSAKRAVVEDDGPLIKIVIPPLPPPDEPEKEPEQTETPIVAPPALADIPTTVPVDAFVTPVEPPPPSSLNVGNVNINLQRANLKNVKIFDLADLDQAPSARFQPSPQYPAELKINGTTGTVIVDYICDFEGHVQNAYVKTSSGSNELDQAAVTGVSRWVFKPGRKGGHAVNVRMEVPIAFDLNGQGMTSMFTTASPFSSSLRVLLLAAFFCASLAPARADDKPAAELSEGTSDKLQDLKALDDANKIDEAMALVDSILAAVPPTSFDRAYVSRIKATYLFHKNDASSRFAAIEPLQTALNLSDTYSYFEAKDAQQLRFYIANLCFERGTISKDPAAQHADFATARTVIEKWLEVAKTDPSARPAPSPAPDSFENVEMFYAQLLYTMAQVDPKHTDLELVKLALAEAEKGLHSAPRPNENLYILKLATLQQLGNYTDAADVLEFLLKSKPDNKTYWQQLTAFYAILASKTKDSKEAFEYNLRAIVTIERAHKYGALNKPEDNFELFSLYFNIGQYQQGAELLESGLRDGSITSSAKNWVLLADAYQQLHKQLKAVEVLHETAKLFPQKGQFSFLAAQILYGMDKTAEALADIQDCVAKDGGDKPVQSWLFYAYLAIELQKFELAGQAVESAAKYPHSASDEQTIANLREAVKSAIEQRDAAFKKTE